MTRIYRAPVAGDLEEKFPKLKEMAAQSDLVFEGDTKKGKISGRLKGSYKFDGVIFQINIDVPPGFENLGNGKVQRLVDFLRGVRSG